MKLSAQPHRGVVAWQSLAQAVGSLTRTSPRPDVAQKRARDPETVWGPLGRHGAHEHRTSCRTSVRQRRLPEGHTRPTITIGATRLPRLNKSEPGAITLVKLECKRLTAHSRITNSR